MIRTPIEVLCAILLNSDVAVVTDDDSFAWSFDKNNCELSWMWKRGRSRKEVAREVSMGGKENEWDKTSSVNILEMMCV